MCSKLPAPSLSRLQGDASISFSQCMAAICMGTCFYAHANCERVTREKCWLNTERLSRLDNDNSLP